jgi:hypothetical protein
MKNYCLYVSIGASKKLLARASKFLKTALILTDINGM